MAVARLVALALTLATAAVVFAVVGVDDLRSSLEAAADSPWGIDGAVAVYVLFVASFAPGTIGTITSAAVFGFSIGLALSALAVAVSALIARRVAAEPMAVAAAGVEGGAVKLGGITARAADPNGGR